MLRLRYQYDSLECVPADGTATAYEDSSGCGDGQAYNAFPLGVSVLALPLIAAMKGTVWLIGPPILRLAGPHLSPLVKAFLSGDFFAAHALVELWSASTFGRLPYGCNIGLSDTLPAIAALLGSLCCSRLERWSSPSEREA